MPKITKEQRSYWHWEFEDFEFKGDLVSGELAADGPIPVYGSEDPYPTPGTVMEVTRILLNEADPRAVAKLTIDGDAADLHYSLMERAELLRLLEQKMADECVAYLERRDAGD